MTTRQHDPRCRAVNFDPDTGRYTGNRAFDIENCQTCRDEATAQAEQPGGAA